MVDAPRGGGQRLVPDAGEARPARRRRADDEGEIRLTYRELSALIEDAIRSLRYSRGESGPDGRLAHVGSDGASREVVR